MASRNRERMMGQDYRAVREKLKWTQRQVAEALGLTTNTIARRERDELPISRESELAIRCLDKSGEMARLRRNAKE